MDAVFHALASGARRRILDIIKATPGCSVNHVSAHFETSRIQTLKHLRVLEDAGLVLSEKRGRVRVLHFNPVPVQLIHERWTTEFSAYWAGQLTALKYRVESTEESPDG
ncbi:MAG: helix-turn-helix domain-containing protein [Candidatus Sumerlaeia bacterium]|nr:helix-turn-helix domain-containing protein [Candidatus Sumerlaeia bacterium]